MVLWARLSVLPKWHIDWCSRICTPHGSVPILYNGPPLFVLKISLPWGSAPHLIHGSLGPPDSAPQMASRILDRFIHFCRAHKSDQQTDRPSTLLCVAISRCHLMWYGLIRLITFVCGLQI